MSFEVIAKKDWPKRIHLGQYLFDTVLSADSLSKKYGFEFYEDSDDISSVELCLIRSDAGSYFLLVFRKEFSSDPTEIRTESTLEFSEGYVRDRYLEFIGSTGFDVSDVNRTWRFVVG